MTSRLPYGPFVRDLDPQERARQLRCLQGLAAVYLGSTSPLIAALRRAETDSAALPQAAELLDYAPSLTRRKMLSVFGAVTWPRPQTVRERAP